MSWTDNAVNETGFKVERHDGVGFVQIAAPGANATGYSDTGLSPETTYTYRVRATNGEGDSDYSNESSATTPGPQPPASPSDLAGMVVSGPQVNLTWTDNASNEWGFELERKTEPSGSFALLVSLGEDAVSYADTSVSADTDYTYRVRATNGAGDSSWSNTVTVDTAAPVSVNIIEVMNPGFEDPIDQAHWWAGTAASQASDAAHSGTYSARFTGLGEIGKRYDMGIPTSPGVTYTVSAWIKTQGLGGTGAFFRVSYVNLPYNLSTGGQMESVKLTGTNDWTLVQLDYTMPVDYKGGMHLELVQDGGGTSWFDDLSVVETTSTLPASPSGISLSPLDYAGQVLVRWTDNSTNESGFRVERSLDGSPWEVAGEVDYRYTFFCDTVPSGTTSAVEAKYRVCATNAAGKSAYSEMPSAMAIEVYSDSLVFYKGVNAGGDAISVNGQSWDGDGGASWSHHTTGGPFTDGSDDATAPAISETLKMQMLQKARWGGQYTANVSVPNGNYVLYIWTLEDNAPSIIDTITVEGETFFSPYINDASRLWERIGPIPAIVNDGAVTIDIFTSTHHEDHMNVSGIEIWRAQ